MCVMLAAAGIHHCSILHPDTLQCSSPFLTPLPSLLWCAGPDFGLKYAVNTPSLLGCSGAVAAITAYKAALQPMGLPGVTLPLPLPIAVLGFVYCCLYIREKVRGLQSRRAMPYSWGLVG